MLTDLDQFRMKQTWVRGEGPGRAVLVIILIFERLRRCLFVVQNVKKREAPPAFAEAVCYKQVASPGLWASTYAS